MKILEKLKEKFTKSADAEYTKKNDEDNGTDNVIPFQYFVPFVSGVHAFDYTLDPGVAEVVANIDEICDNHINATPVDAQSDDILDAYFESLYLIQIDHIANEKASHDFTNTHIVAEAHKYKVMNEVLHEFLLNESEKAGKGV